jgi:hypothetical protein
MSRLRTRLPHLLSLWAAAVLAEGLLSYFFLSRPYFSTFFMPFAIVVLVGAVVGTWRILRPRGEMDRRVGDRRAHRRRASQ